MFKKILFQIVLLIKMELNKIVILVIKVNKIRPHKLKLHLIKFLNIIKINKFILNNKLKIYKIYYKIKKLNFKLILKKYKKMKY